MRTSIVAAVERDQDTDLLVGYVPGFAGAYSLGTVRRERDQNLQEVLRMLVDDQESEVFIAEAQVPSVTITWPSACRSKP